jgi:3-hydroxybutyrate dehydrogenase
MGKDEVAIVTGSTSGIGLGIAHALAAVGTHVMLNGFGDKDAIDKIRNDLARQHGIKTAYLAADVSKPVEIRGLIAETERQLGVVGVLVNNAGIQHVAPATSFQTTNGTRLRRSTCRLPSMPSRPPCRE